MPWSIINIKQWHLEELLLFAKVLSVSALDIFINLFFDFWQVIVEFVRLVTEGRVRISRLRFVIHLSNLADLHWSFEIA